jgi:hypothetical protein
MANEIKVALTVTLTNGNVVDTISKSNNTTQLFAGKDCFSKTLTGANETITFPAITTPKFVFIQNASTGAETIDVGIFVTPNYHMLITLAPGEIAQFMMKSGVALGVKGSAATAVGLFHAYEGRLV